MNFFELLKTTQVNGGPPPDSTTKPFIINVFLNDPFLFPPPHSIFYNF